MLPGQRVRPWQPVTVHGCEFGDVYAFGLDTYASASAGFSRFSRFRFRGVFCRGRLAASTT